MPTPRKPTPASSPLLSNSIIVAVTLVWVMSSAVGLALERYVVLEVVTPPFLIVLGALFGQQVIQRQRNGA